MSQAAPAAALAARITARQQHVDAENSWRFTRLRPLAQLSPWIQGYCDYEEVTAGFSTRRELPHAEGVLIINLGEPVQITGGNGAALALRAGQGFVAGVHLRSALSQSSGRQCGLQVQLPLSTVHQLLGVPMDQLLDQVVALDDLLPAASRAALHQLPHESALGPRLQVLEQLLAGLLQRRSPDPRVGLALRLLRTQPDLDIQQVAHTVGWSRKHLAQQVTRSVGVGPRCYRRLLRFQSAAERVRSLPGQPVDWAALAADSGYCDQSHLIREFREFAGLTPAQCLARTLADGGGLVEG